MAAKALGVLSHIAAFWAGLWRGQQVGKAAFLATQRRLQQVAVAIGPRAKTQEPFSRAQWGGTDRLVEIRDGMGEDIPQSKGQGFRFKSCLCCLAMSLEAN